MNREIRDLVRSAGAVLDLEGVARLTATSVPLHPDVPPPSGNARKAHPTPMDAHYYHPQHLARFPEIGKNQPELAKKFFDWYGAVFAEGALGAREKSLIALAVAHAVQCPYCIDAYSHDALQKGADVDQMTEAVHVAAAIRGGASLVHGLQMRTHVEKVGM